MPKKLNATTTATDKSLRLFCRLLFTGKRHYLNEMAEWLQCSKATVIRLMDGIETTGLVSIETGIENRRRWYQLGLLSGNTPRLAFSRDEVEKLALCRDLLACLLPQGMEQVVADSLAKVSMLMHNNDERSTATAPRAIRLVRGHIDYTPFQDILNCLLRVIPDHAVCILTYAKQGKKIRDFEVVPIRLMVDGDTLNVEGWRVTDKGTPEIRSPITLAVQRIQACVPTCRRLENCPPLPPLEGAFGIVGDEPFMVRVVFSSEYSQYIRERIWSEDQELIDSPNGGVELVFTATSREQVVSWILSFGGEAELLEPAEVRADIAAHIQRLQRVYGHREKVSHGF